TKRTHTTASLVRQSLYASSPTFVMDAGGTAFRHPVPTIVVAYNRAPAQPRTLGPGTCSMPPISNTAAATVGVDERLATRRRPAGVRPLANLARERPPWAKTGPCPDTRRRPDQFLISGKRGKSQIATLRMTTQSLRNWPENSPA